MDFYLRYLSINMQMFGWNQVMLETKPHMKVSLIFVRQHAIIMNF